MENILLNELVRSANDVHKTTSDLGPSYNEAMKNALGMFKEAGLPTKKNEDWLYTNISKTLSPKFYSRASEIIQDIPEMAINQEAMIILNNGIFNRFQSVLPEGIEIDQMIGQTKFFDAFDSLNFATAQSPIFIKINKNTVLDIPLSIVHLTDEAGINKIVSPRIHITAESFSKVSIAEIFTSTQNLLFQYTTNSSINFELKENAFVEHVKFQLEAYNATHIGLTKANLAKSATFKSMTIDLGILTSRHNIDVEVLGEGAEAHVNGLYALGKKEHSDVFSAINHRVGNTYSEQLFKGILAGEGHGAFTGKIQIDQDAQLVNSNQLNNNLMLSKKAHIDTRPILVVSAHDVKCAHGATIGQLSEDESFYLQARGISKDMAHRMLCQGFATDVLFRIDHKTIRDLAILKLAEKFTQFSAEVI